MKQHIRPKIFMSACIEYDSCRYDGEKITDVYIKRLLDYVDVIRVCPELAIGMGAPRDAVRLVQRKGEELKLLSTNKGDDYTEKMVEFVSKYTEKLKDKTIDGFILKAKSPTCGISNVKVYQDIGKSHVLHAKNDGMFGGKIKEIFPDAPIETERRLSNFKIRDRFFTQLFTLANFRMLSLKMKELVQFHSDNKYLFMAYNQRDLKQLGNIVANHQKLPVEEVFSQYSAQLKMLLSKEVSMKKRLNVYTHIYGYFKNQLSASEKEFYFDTLDQYLNSRVPFSNVLVILKGWSIRFNEEYLLKQTIFEPYPKELIMVTDSGKKI